MDLALQGDRRVVDIDLDVLGVQIGLALEGKAPAREGAEIANASSQVRRTMLFVKTLAPRAKLV